MSQRRIPFMKRRGRIRFDKLKLDAWMSGWVTLEKKTLMRWRMATVMNKANEPIIRSSNANSDDTVILTVQELAQWLRVQPSTIYSWVETGRLPCIRIVGRLRFSRGDILRWLEARKEG